MWTSTALASELRGYAGTVWRVVEAQHRISTSRLAADARAQQMLEELVEEVKPLLPAGAHHLHFLLAAPFRYGHALPSRFRRANERPGIFYAAEHEATAIAEAAYWRLRFYSRSPGFVPPATTTEHSSFRAVVKAQRALDLTRAPFVAEKVRWTDPVDYSACQALAGAARDAGCELIRSRSARDPGRGCTVAVRAPEAFAERAPRPDKTWHLRFENGQLLALAAFPGEGRFAFTADQFGL